MSNNIIPITDNCRDNTGMLSQQYMVDGCHVKLVYPATTNASKSMENIQSILLDQQHVPAV